MPAVLKDTPVHKKYIHLEIVHNLYSLFASERKAKVANPWISV